MGDKKTRGEQNLATGTMPFVFRRLPVNLSGGGLFYRDTAYCRGSGYRNPA